MAKINSKGLIKGAIGPVVYRSYNEQQILQSKPGKGAVRQTPATKGSASEFGQASRLSKSIRLSLLPILQNHHDTAFFRRLTSKILAAATTNNPKPPGCRSVEDGDLSLLDNLDCNAGSPFSDHFAVKKYLNLDSGPCLSIRLCPFEATTQVLAVPKASHAKLCFLAIAIDPVTLKESGAEFFEIPFALNHATTDAIDWTTPPFLKDQLVVVASALFYYQHNKLAGMISLNNKALHPCEISVVLRT